MVNDSAIMFNRGFRSRYEINNMISSNRADYNSFMGGLYPHVSIYDNAIKRGQMSEKLMKRMCLLGYY